MLVKHYSTLVKVKPSGPCGKVKSSKYVLYMYYHLKIQNLTNSVLCATENSEVPIVIFVWQSIVKTFNIILSTFKNIISDNVGRVS